MWELYIVVCNIRVVYVCNGWLLPRTVNGISPQSLHWFSLDGSIGTHFTGSCISEKLKEGVEMKQRDLLLYKQKKKIRVGSEILMIFYQKL